MALTVSNLAAETGLTPDTIRYYERIGLLPEPNRSHSGYRLYEPEAAERLRFIKGAQRFGLRLEEIKELLEIRDRGLCPCGHTHALLSKRIEEVDEELSRLQALRGELARMVVGWSAEGCGDGSGEKWYCAGEFIKTGDVRFRGR